MITTKARRMLVPALLLLAFTADGLSQPSLPWSGFGSGGGISVFGHIVTQSLVGGTFTGASGPGPVIVKSGFLAYPPFAGTVGVPLGLQGGWNMVAVPSRVSDPRKTSLFPEAISNAFKFENGYFAEETLLVGRGYWMKFSTPQTETVWGIPERRETVAVVQGWNLIGGIGAPVNDGDVGSIPGGIVVSNFFRFDNPAGYSASSTIDPGRAYWVKTNQAGSLIFDDNLGMMPRVVVRPTDELPPPPPETDAPAEVIAARGYAVDQAWPNPFNPSTTISFSLAERSVVRLAVFDALGRNVATLLEGEQSAGEHAVQWNAERMPSGVYFFRLQAGGRMTTGRLALIR